MLFSFIVLQSLLRVTTFFSQERIDNNACVSHSISHILNIKYGIELDPMPLYFRSRNSLTIANYNSELHKGLLIEDKLRYYTLNEVSVDSIDIEVNLKNPLLYVFQPTNTYISNPNGYNLCFNDNSDKYLRNEWHAVVIVGKDKDGYLILDSKKGLYNMCTKYFYTYWRGTYKLTQYE